MQIKVDQAITLKSIKFIAWRQRCDWEAVSIQKGKTALPIEWIFSANSLRCPISDVGRSLSGKCLLEFVKAVAFKKKMKKASKNSILRLFYF